jgi:hypothetical protein
MGMVGRGEGGSGFQPMVGGRFHGHGVGTRERGKRLGIGGEERWSNDASLGNTFWTQANGAGLLEGVR